MNRTISSNWRESWALLVLRNFMAWLLTWLGCIPFQNSCVQEAYHANKGTHQLDLNVLNGERDIHKSEV